MKRSALFLAALVGALVSLLFVHLWFGAAPVKAQGTIQYIVVGEFQDGRELQGVLNKYGAEGWELKALTQPEAQKHFLIFEKGRH